MTALHGSCRCDSHSNYHAVGLNPTLKLGSIQRIFPFFHLSGVSMVWLPWSTRAGTVEANILYLGPGEQLPPLPVNGYFQFPATSQLRDVAGDVAQHGCQQCTVEALAIFARPLPYLNNVTSDVPAAATSDTDSDLTEASSLMPLHLQLQLTRTSKPLLPTSSYQR